MGLYISQSRVDYRLFDRLKPAFLPRITFHIWNVFLTPPAQILCQLFCFLAADDVPLFIYFFLGLMPTLPFISM